MIINLFKTDNMFSLSLPEKVKGQFWVRYRDDQMQMFPLVSIEAEDDRWVIKSNKTAFIVDDAKQRMEKAMVEPLGIYRVWYKQADGQPEGKALLFCEPESSDRQLFKKYIALSPVKISIGRTEENNLSYKNSYVSSCHAELFFNGKSWSITDAGSGNGTFVNGVRIAQSELAPGDCIYIMGLKIIIGGNYFSINNPDGLLTVKAPLSAFNRQPTEEREMPTDVEGLQVYYRSPRFKRSIETMEISVDPPPQMQKPEQTPLGLMLGPALTMSVSTSSFGFFSVYQVVNGNGNMITAMPAVMMSVSMLLGSIMWPLLTRRHQRKQLIKYEGNREAKYLYYLNTIRDEIKRKIKEQSEIISENNPSVDECAALVANSGRDLWGRVVTHNDFLQARLGLGEQPLDARIDYPTDGFSLEDDHLKNAVVALKNEKKVLTNVPIGVSLVKDFLTGIIGVREEALALTRSIILQIISLHSYDEVKLVLIYSQEEARQWEFARFIPHLWNDGKTARYLATDADEIKELSFLLEGELANRKGEKADEYMSSTPYYVIISANKSLYKRSDVLQELLTKKHNCGASVIMLYDKLNNLPKETTAVVQTENGESVLFNKNDIIGKSVPFKAETADVPLVRSVMGTLANIRLDLAEEQGVLPTMYTFLEMYNVGKIEHLNVLNRWRENDPTVTLQAPIGVDKTGELFYLDLHEKFHGPHGLVAGMTGSGKSELIITYIVSMAVNYHPNEVAFILIDYKGGGLAGAFENDEKGIRLPHLAGTITNLDGASINRSLISIQSELRKRQAIFNDARKKTGEGTMDIYKYQKMFREGVLDKPVPHLFIISDEFAELKSQQPDFMEQMISAARIGRSLGVHLVLATQKPAGVVNDQIWSNSRFRVCLKVQEKSDSMDMIKCDDAAELSQTGRFYLQVGFNELFDMGQSAWCGAEYIPSDQPEKKIDSSIQVVNNLGRVLKEEKPAAVATEKKARTTQIASLVQHLSGLAEEVHARAELLWLPPMPAQISVESLEAKYSLTVSKLTLNPIIGEYDDPANQLQGLLTLPITEEGNCIVYGAAGSGKTTFLTTVIYSLLKKHTPEELNLYIMDFGAQTLRVFSKAPHVGGVVLLSEDDKVRQLFKMLADELALRKTLFSDYGGDLHSFYKATSKVVPNIVVMLNNFSAFTENYDSLADTLITLTQEGIKYGIYFIISASSAGAVRYRTQQNFKQFYVLRLNDAVDYSTLLGNTKGLTPAKHRGRGLVRTENLYEFQTARCVNSDEPSAFLQKFCAELSAKSKNRARKIPVLPEVVDAECLADGKASVSHMPVGIAKISVVPVFVDLQSKFILLVLAHDAALLKAFAQGLEDVLAGLNTATLYFDGEDAENSPAEFIEKQHAIITERERVFKESTAALNGTQDVTILLLNPVQAYERLSEEGKTKFSEMMDKGRPALKVRFILFETKALADLMHENWYRNNLTGDGIWLGDGMSEQYLIKTTKSSADLYNEIGDSFGYIVNKGKHTLIKTVTRRG